MGPSDVLELLLCPILYTDTREVRVGLRQRSFCWIYGHFLRFGPSPGRVSQRLLNWSRQRSRRIRRGRKYPAPFVIFNQILVTLLFKPVGIRDHVAGFEEPIHSGATESLGRSRRRIW